MSSHSSAAASSVVQLRVEPTFAAQTVDDRDRAAHAVVGAVAPCLRGRLVGVANEVQGASDRGDPRVPIRLHARPGVDLGGRVRRGLDGIEPRPQVLLLVDLGDQRDEERRAVGKVQVDGLARDPSRARDRGDVGHRGVVLLDQSASRGEDTVARA